MSFLRTASPPHQLIRLHTRTTRGRSPFTPCSARPSLSPKPLFAASHRRPFPSLPFAPSINHHLLRIQYPTHHTPSLPLLLLLLLLRGPRRRLIRRLRRPAACRGDAAVGRPPAADPRDGRQRAVPLVVPIGGAHGPQDEEEGGKDPGARVGPPAAAVVGCVFVGVF